MADDLIERLREALRGVTPGPWDVMTCNTVRAIDGDVAIPIFDARTPWKKHRHTSTVVKQEWHNCRYVVAAQPDNIRTLLDALAAAESQLEMARKALAPFAGDKLPSSRKIKIAYNRHGLRCAMSDLEIAQDAAARALAEGETKSNPSQE